MICINYIHICPGWTNSYLISIWDFSLMVTELSADKAVWTNQFGTENMWFAQAKLSNNSYHFHSCVIQSFTNPLKAIGYM